MIHVRVARKTGRAKMSEPMSNHEIEDVLSSIRRLVSEDLRPTAKAEAQAPQPEADPKPAPLQLGAKLLLTPSLRVIDTPAEDELLAAETQPVEEGEVRDEMVFSSMDDDVLMAGPADAPHAEDVAQEADPEVQDVVSRLGAAVGDADDEWESPVGDPPAWDDVALSDSQTGEILHSRLHFRRTEEDEAPEPEMDAPDFGVSEPYAEDLTDQDEIDAVEEPPVAPRRPVQPPSDDWAAHAEAEVRAELERDIEDQAETLFSGAEVHFDEEVLRDLVRDIIREELAGTLGERITRNVRKLVRAEIARALAVREFE